MQYIFFILQKYFYNIAIKLNVVSELIDFWILLRLLCVYWLIVNCSGCSKEQVD